MPGFKLCEAVPYCFAKTSANGKIKTAIDGIRDLIYLSEL